METTDNKKEVQEEDNEKVKKFNYKILIIITLIFIVLLLILSTIFAIINMGNDKIISGIKINDINVKGLSIEEANKKLNEELIENGIKKIILKNEDFEYEILLEQIEFSYDIQNAVNMAYEYGRSSNIFANNYETIKALISGENIEIEYTYNQEILNEILDDLAKKIPGVVSESDFYIDGNELVITSGESGNSVNKDEVKEQIISAITLNKNEEIEINFYKKEPDEINIEKIYEEVYTEPKDAYFTKDPFKIYAHVDGIDFDIEQAKEILKEEKDEYRVPITITHPEKLTTDLGTEAFPNLLGSFSTNYSEANVNRSTNLKLAAGKVNGTIVAPGETFSYNKTVGERTVAAGYRNAAGYSGGKVVDMLGGGICQISSTLYDAVVYADLEIVERKNHMFLSSYTTAGKDATVVYGSIDFKFKNTRNYPILIKMYAQNGVAKAEIYGVNEETEYEIGIETTVLSYIGYSTTYIDDSSLNVGEEKVEQGGMSGCKSVTYKVKSLNGVEVSREVLSSDTYQAMNKRVRRGTTQQYVEPVVDEEYTEETTTENIQENTTEQTESEIYIVTEQNTIN